MKKEAQAGMEKWNELERLFEQDAGIVLTKIQENHREEWKKYCNACYELEILGDNENALRMNSWIFSLIELYKNKDLELFGAQFFDVRYDYYLIQKAAEEKKASLG